MSIGRTPTLVICIAGAVISLGALALPGNEDPAPSPPGGRDSASPAVEIIDFTYAGTTDVAAGAAIDVTNSDSAAHTLTAADGAFDTGVLGASASGSITAPAEPGAYAYFCSIHPSMTGTLRVLE